MIKPLADPVVAQKWGSGRCRHERSAIRLNQKTIFGSLPCHGVAPRLLENDRSALLRFDFAMIRASFLC